MTLATGKSPNNLNGGRIGSGARAFTLIELVLVLLLLTIVISLVTPALSRFFAGRTLDSETRQLLALTRYGQSRAVSEGMPMVLWVDAAANRYGLQSESGYAVTNGDPKAVEYTLGEGLRIGVQVARGKMTRGNHRVGLHFLPDGANDAATSVAAVTLQQGNFPALLIVPTADGLNYEVQKANGRR